MEHVAVSNRPNWLVEVSTDCIASSVRDQIQGKQREQSEAIGEVSEAVARRSASRLGRLAVLIPSWDRFQRRRKLKKLKAELEAMTKWHRFLSAMPAYEKISLNANDFDYFFPGESFQAMNMDH